MIKKLNPWLLVLIAVVLPFNAVLMNYLLKAGMFEPLSIATNYLIQPTLVANAISIVAFAAIIFLFGKLDLEAVLVSKEKVIPAILFVSILWVLSQLISIGLSFFLKGDLALTEDFSVTIGKFTGQFFGNAAFEELIYRGVFFVQLYLILKVKVKNRTAIFSAVLLSQLFFALIHIPSRLMIHQVDNLVAELLKLFVVGIILTIVFIRTENLLFLIGSHALINAPVNITKPVFPVELIVLLVTILAALFWNRLVVKKDPSFKTEPVGF
ncbi:CPBP family intramembrane glutamic endopeptidase [Mangrovibacterium lignilyticum]|uniref:CPBP family intramembrane glutamic endopeptidase n=1 Tax=Mangrovibacterium lignilyticum TaxID=2668052 RepID=UPI0013D28C40|nr:CPBP family intramembrane glutamic endopeptidase [Mangrovibacterium lignilyticum]